MAADHRRSYETAIAAAAGDRVTIVRRDDEAPDWMWCEHPSNGRAGWVPVEFLDLQTCVLRRDYSAMELTVVAGQIVDAVETASGWTWCQNADGTAGWVPTGKLTTDPSR